MPWATNAAFAGGIASNNNGKYRACNISQHLLSQSVYWWPDFFFWEKVCSSTHKRKQCRETGKRTWDLMDHNGKQKCDLVDNMCAVVWIFGKVLQTTQYCKGWGAWTPLRSGQCITGCNTESPPKAFFPSAIIPQKLPTNSGVPTIMQKKFKSNQPKWEHNLLWTQSSLANIYQVTKNPCIIINWVPYELTRQDRLAITFPRGLV